MRAAVRHQYGGAEVLNIEEVPTPIPADDEVLVRVHAASVNLGDWEILTGRPLYIPMLMRIFGPRPRHKVVSPAGGASPRRRWPFEPRYKILGSDVAGRVEAVGRSVTRFSVGDDVFGDCSMRGGGSFAEYVCVPETAALVHKPAGLTFEQAAAVPHSSFIALRGLRDKVRCQRGHKVLINGAGGGAGTIAVQLAKSYGAEVTGVDGPDKQEMLRSIGADHVIDYTREDFTQNGQQYDIILDLAAYRSVFKSRRSLAPNGIYMMVGGSWTALWQCVFLGPLISSIGNGRATLLAVVPKRDDLTLVTALLEAGTVAPIIDRCYPLDEIRDAIRRVGEKQSMGKVIVTP